MRIRLLALAIVACLIGPACANELAPELRILLDGFAAHRRLAIGYLRTGNTELGAVEIERLRDRWARDRRALPAPTTSDRTLIAAFAASEAAINDGLAAADKGETESARSLLEGAASPLTAWRKANNIRLFSDCIAEASVRYEALDGYRLRPPNLTDPASAAAVVAAAASTAAAIGQCNAEAPAAIRDEPEFRRLIDGMLNSLRQVHDAVRQRDENYLQRLLSEQRSFDRLLAFRFG